MPDTDLTAAGALPTRASWYRRLYQNIEALSSSRYAFALMIPMVLAQPKRWWWLAALGTVASMFGGIIGYELGKLVHAGAMSFLSIDLNAHVHRFGIDASVGELLGDNFWVLSLLCSVLPTPFKVVAIGSGMVLVPLERFLLAALIGRTVRFFAVAGAMAFLGPKARRWLRV